ncbi:MAG: hypothetical protein ACI89X_000478 [Planctomycetota bacterium]
MVLLVGALIFSFGDGPVAARPPTEPQGGAERPIEAPGDQAGGVKAAGVQRAELTDLPIQNGVGRAVRLQVVTSAGVPVVGAEVLYWPAGEADFQELRRLFKAHGRDMEATLRAHGGSAITDDAGLVEVRAAPESDVCARFGSDYGELYLYGRLGASSDASRIVLMNDVTLEVDVVDHDGRPVAGRLVYVAGTFLSRMSDVVSVSDAFGPSNSAGKVVVPHLLYKVDVWGELLNGELQVYSRRQYDDEVRPVTIATQKVPYTALHGVVKVQLVEPVGGLLEVCVLDADRKPIDARVSLSEEGGAVWMVYPPTMDKVSLFAGVPLGRRWRAVAHCAGQDHALDVVGPRASGQRVSVDLSVPIRSWRFTGRVVRADGSPIVKTHVNLAPQAPHPFLGWREGSQHSMKSDESGRLGFSMWLPASVRSLPGFTVSMVVGGVSSPAFRIERSLTVEDSDLGDLVNSQLDEDCVLATLEFSCEGKPLNDAWVEVSQGTRVVEVKKKRRGHVLELWGVEPHRGPLNVTCKHIDCLDKQVQMPPGERASVDLLPSASLVIRMDCGELPVEDTWALLVPIERADERYTARLDTEQQVCEWGSLPPGRYRLRIFTHGVVVHDEAEVALQKGGNVWPSNGKRLDLGSRVRGIYVLARSAKTRRRVEVEAVLVPRASMVLPDDPKLVSLWFPQPDKASDLLVRAWGYVPMRVESPQENLFLQLRPLTSLRLGQPQTAFDEVRVRMLVDALIDPLLVAFDDQGVHDHAFEFEKWGDGTFEQDFIPGTKLELTPIRGGVPGKPVEVVVGTTSPQVLQL